MQEVIKLKDVTKIYKKNHQEIVILENINYNFFKGKTYCIMGKSGSGKTTLIEMLGLLKKPTLGTIYLNNKDISKMSEKEKSSIINTEIGFIFQSFYLIPTMTALENVMLPMYLNKKMSLSKIKLQAEKLLKKMGLEDRKNHYPKELSGGEQQRISIARAIINNPSIILADEPTGALDSENTKKILTILKDLANNGKCVIIVSHNTDTKNYADEVIMIKNKNIRSIENVKVY